LKSGSFTKRELNHLLNFIGYGRPEADIWFLGMEEAGGGEDNLRARLQFEQIEDLARAHSILGITKHHSGRKVIQPTWRGMCYILLKLNGQPTDSESIREYQAEKLGRFHGDTFLFELMPIPKPKINSWGYENFIPQFHSTLEYYETVKPQRIRLLRQFIQQHQPKIVIGYGKMHWKSYQALFPQIVFKQKNEFLAGEKDNTFVLLTHHFTAREMNRKLDDVVLLIRHYLRKIS